MTEVISGFQFDYKTYLAGCERLDFFHTPLGCAKGAADNNKAAYPEDTNMFLPSTLPANTQLLVTSIEVVYMPDTSGQTARADYARVARSGFFQLFIGSKVYVQVAPLGPFMRPWVMTQKLKDGQRIDSVPWTHGPYQLEKPHQLLITGEQHFAASLLWSDRKRSPMVHCPARVGVVLHGSRQRPVC